MSAISRIDGPGREGVGAAREVLLDDVVLGRALERGALDPVLVGDRDVEAEQPGGGRVDRHRRVHLVERDAVEERVHVALVGDRDADLADLAAREHVVGVVAGLGGQVEGDREPGLALGEVAPVELVRAPGVRVPGVGAHHPGAVGLGRGGDRSWRTLSQVRALGTARVASPGSSQQIDTMHLGRDRVIAAHLVARPDRRPGPGVGARQLDRRRSRPSRGRCCSPTSTSTTRARAACSRGASRSCAST